MLIVTPFPAPAVKGWCFVRSDADGDARVYVYERDASATPQRPTERKFGAGLMGEGYSDKGKTMTVRVSTKE